MQPAAGLSALQPTGAVQTAAGANVLNNPAASISTPSKSNGVYWVGADGNVYVKGSQGTNAAGKADANTASYWGSRGFNGIADPNPPQTNNTAPAQNGSGAASNYQNKAADIAVQEGGLGSVQATQDAGTAAVNKALSTITGQYEGDLGTAKTEYGADSNSNQTDLQSNKQTSLENAVQGRQGLYSTLASLGALNGTGLELANNAVQKGANTDLTTAADTYATNQRGLDTGYNTYTTNEQRLEQKAKDAAANDIQQVQHDALASKQTYLKNLADDYTAEGNTGQAKTYADQVAALFPQLASTNVPTIDLGYTGAAYTAPTLSQYVGQANNTTVQTTPSKGGTLAIPGLVAVNKKNTNGV